MKCAVSIALIAILSTASLTNAAPWMDYSYGLDDYSWSNGFNKAYEIVSSALETVNDYRNQALDALDQYLIKHHTTTEGEAGYGCDGPYGGCGKQTSQYGSAGWFDDWGW